jgi:anaphase-promoting complex subunit 2
MSLTDIKSIYNFWHSCSSPAIEDLKLCLEYTGQHSKLVDSFISSLRYRLLTAGASTNDILHQYVSTIKALRTIDPTGVFLEAVGEPIRDYLRGRKDTIKCIVTMLTDGSGGNASGTGNAGDNLLEELNRDAENQENADYDNHANIDEKQAWLNSERYTFFMLLIIMSHYVSSEHSKFGMLL